MAKANKNQRAARRQAARKQAAREQAASKKAPAKPAAAMPAATKPGGRPPAPAEAPADAMSVARRIAWWALLAMVFLVPVAMSNLTFLGFSLPFTYCLLYTSPSPRDS